MMYFLLLIEQVQEALALVSAGAFTASKRLNKKYKDVFFIMDKKDVFFIMDNRI